MMPKWIKEIAPHKLSHRDLQLYQALSIAWEALERIEKDCRNCNTCGADVMTKDALRRISEAGK